MTPYRIYVLDRHDGVTDELEDRFCNDNEALARAEDAYEGQYAAEVYHGERLVARLGGALTLE